MIRPTAIATIAWLSFIAQTHAAVIITHSAGIDVPNLPGYKSYTITATSTIVGELFQGVDFAGNRNNNDPATAKGFFGAMNHVGLPTLNTIYQDNNALIPFVFTGKSSAEDSQFIVSTLASNVSHPGGLDEEGPNILQGIWAWTVPQGQSIPVAQLVIPSGGTVSYRGSFALNTPRGIIDSPNVSGIIPEPSTLALLTMISLTGVAYAEGRRRCVRSL